MTIAATIDLLQTINATVTGVGQAPLLADYPITEIDEIAFTMPLLLTFPGSGLWEREGPNYKITRPYDMVLYGRRAYQEDFVTGKQLVYPVLDALGKTYLTESTYTSGIAYVLQCGPPKIRVDISQPVTDQNESDEWLPMWAGVMYHGFRYTLTVIEEGTL